MTYKLCSDGCRFNKYSYAMWCKPKSEESLLAWALGNFGIIRSENFKSKITISRLGEKIHIAPFILI